MFSDNQRLNRCFVSPHSVGQKFGRDVDRMARKREKMSLQILGRVVTILCLMPLCMIATAEDTTMKRILPSEDQKMAAGESKQRKDSKQENVPGQKSGEVPATPKEADKLEHRLKQHPNDFNARLLLLEYYYWQMIRSPSAHLAHERHVLWVIRHQPASDIAGAPAMTLLSGKEDDAILKAKQLWRQQMSAHPRNAKIVGNAASFFLKQGSEAGFELLNRAQALEPKNPKWPEKLGEVYSERMNFHTGKQHREAAQKALLAYERWWRLAGEVNEDNGLDALPVVAFEAGELDKARLYATKLLELVARHDRKKFGDAIHKSNLILGRLALKSGDVEKAKSYLLASGRTPGSPVLGSFGPNMMLAKELLEKGERQAVLDYFSLCAKFWTYEGGKKLEQWTAEVKAGKMPDFGANLLY
jgi:hypothetical protein